MKITLSNYDEVVQNIDWKSAPPALANNHKDLIPKVCKNSWAVYHKNSAIRATIDKYFELLEIYLASVRQPTDKAASGKAKLQRKKPAPKSPQKPIAAKAAKEKKQPSKPQWVTKEVAHIDSDVSFIRRYAAMNGKTKTAADILRLLKGLQKAIVEGRISKTSPNAHIIHDMQESLTNCFEKMKGVGMVTLSIPDFKLKQYLEIAHSEIKSLSVNLLSAYIRLHGAKGIREAAKRLHGKIYKAVQSGKIKDDDRYISQLDRAYENLDHFLQERHVVLNLHHAELNGLAGITGVSQVKKKDSPALAGITTSDLLEAKLGGKELHVVSLGSTRLASQVQSQDQGNFEPLVMNSMDFAKMTFKTIGLKGKWGDFIGDPPPRFRIMVSAKPKMGKSTLCIEFAGYLARHHGKTLYVAKEEGLDSTLQRKLNNRNIAHPNLDVASSIPPNIGDYRFIFLDSVNRLNLSPEDLIRLNKNHNEFGQIEIYQTTKEGVFKGANAYQHDVDSIIEIPEKGKARQYGRFNQGGEMDIVFPDSLGA